jgi:hypothetical protein
MKLYSPKAIKRASHAKLHGNTEAARRRRRERDLRKRLKTAQTRTTSTPVEAASAAAAARLWAPAQAGELARQNLLQRQRLLDAEDMGLVAVADPRDLQTYREKVRKTHQKYLHKQQTVAGQKATPNRYYTWHPDLGWR